MAPPSRTHIKPVARQRHILALLALWAATLLAYSNSFSGGMVFDNQRAILQDSRIRAATSENLNLIWTQDYWYKNSEGGLFRPLTTLSYLFNFAILGNGTQTPGYHAVNIFLQLINVALVYFLALLIFQELLPAFALAALWGLHPILTESVTNIVGRADLLAALGVLAALLCYVHSLKSEGNRRIAWLVALAAATALGIFSKESGIVILAAMALYDLAFRPNSDWRWRAAGYGAALLPVAIYLQMRSQVLFKEQALVIPFTDNPLVGADFLTARLTAVKVIGSYLKLLALPIQLSCDHSFAQIPLFAGRFNNLDDWKAVFALLLCLAAAAAAYLGWRRSKPVFFFIAFFFAALAPTSNIFLIIGSPMAERFLYLPSIGFVGCLVWAVWNGIPALRPRVPTIVGIVCLLFAVRTFARNMDWHDEKSLWSATVQTSPDSYRAHENLSLAIINGGEVESDLALAEMQRSVAIMDELPDDKKIPRVWATLGLCYRLRGDVLAKSSATQPGYTPQTNPWYQKALATFQRGTAIDRIWGERVAQQNRLAGKIISTAGWPPLYLGLGRLYVRMEEPQKALEALAYGRSLAPQPEFSQEISAIYKSVGDYRQAAVALMEGLTMEPTQSVFVNLLAQLYRETAPGTCALSGKKLNLNCPLVHEELCVASRNVAQLESQMNQREKSANTVAGAVQTLGCPAEMFK